MASRSSIELLQGSHEVLVLDCTYKTNRFRMPLLAITGKSGLGATFHVAFVFLGQERQSDYEWALEGLRSLYDSAALGAPETLVTDRDLGFMGPFAPFFRPLGSFYASGTSRRTF
jgi:hypothetical protein